ncbi:hypothetical protein BU26DRAFT_562943 [Trematosphaeria pertusa]|uniref:RING-type domain-containing protein n=1 Tax=Trematosphaeria pertusa TaxID=390896 RepID=A0A6A6IMD1_9PLEO|nr:uncharacterized protein BU26DRAFT_562943 [Trematosphaeria pertusa]KAF2250982.1 hypothetical protein BU26DRAFT_562943 [Trematosphaeria pertusa]
MSTPSLPTQAEYFCTRVLPLTATYKRPASGTQCSICCEELREQGHTHSVVILTDCYHFFHTACILPWFTGSNQRRGSCPNCRRELFVPDRLSVPPDEADVLPGVLELQERVEGMDRTLDRMLQRRLRANDRTDRAAAQLRREDAEHPPQQSSEPSRLERMVEQADAVTFAGANQQPQSLSREPPNPPPSGLHRGQQRRVMMQGVRNGQLEPSEWNLPYEQARALAESRRNPGPTSEQRAQARGETSSMNHWEREAFRQRSRAEQQRQVLADRERRERQISSIQAQVAELRRETVRSNEVNANTLAMLRSRGLVHDNSNSRRLPEASMPPVQSWSPGPERRNFSGEESRRHLGEIDRVLEEIRRLYGVWRGGSAHG